MRELILLCLALFLAAFPLNTGGSGLTKAHLPAAAWQKADPDGPATAFPNDRPEIFVNTWRSHGVAFDSLQGIYAYSNAFRGKYQCTELVHRFLKRTYGIPTRIGMGLGHANRMLPAIFDVFGDRSWQSPALGCPVKLVLFQNGTADEAPRAGSAISFEAGAYGHVAIVRYVEKLKTDSLRLYLFEQHGFPKHRPGQPKEIRTIRLYRNEAGDWTGAMTAGVGTPNYWVNVVAENGMP